MRPTIDDALLNFLTEGRDRRATAQRNLLDLMNLQRFAGVVKTSDGYYIARANGDLGYNDFLGRPTAPHPGPGRDAMLRIWNSLSHEERMAVYRLATNPTDGAPIPLHKDFGVPLLDEEE